VPGTVVYDEEFWPDVRKLTGGGANEKQVRKKVLAIIEHPTRVGAMSVNPTSCRHVDVCHGQLVIFWEYTPATDTVTFLRFATHKKAFR
jgi:hypothetical protein